MFDHSIFFPFMGNILTPHTTSSFLKHFQQIGHNLGFAHSGEAQAYDDQTGMMGYSYSNSNGPIMCFNGAKSWQTRWYTDKETKVGASTGNDAACFEGQLHGIANYDDASASMVLIKIEGNSGNDHYIAYNRKDGINSGTVEGGNTVTVTSRPTGETSYGESDLLAKMSAGTVTGPYGPDNLDGEI